MGKTWDYGTTTAHNGDCCFTPILEPTTGPAIESSPPLSGNYIVSCTDFDGRTYDSRKILKFNSWFA